MIAPKSHGQAQAAHVKAALGMVIPALPSQRDRFEQMLAATWGDGSRIWKEGDCKLCGCNLGDEFIDLTLGDAEPVRYRIINCADYEPIIVDHYNGGSRHNLQPESMHPRWDKDCPPVFREMLDGIRPMGPIDRIAFERVTDWRPSDGRGLAISGDSGIGKTTAIWGLARNLEDAGRNPIVVTSVELFRVLARNAKELEREQWLSRCGVLIIDDLGKERVTPAAAAMLWELIEERTTHLRPLVITARYTGSAFVARFAEQEMGNDIRGRIAGACSHIHFERQPNKGG